MRIQRTGLSLTPYWAILALIPGFLYGCADVAVPVEGHYNRGVDLYDQEKYGQAIESYKLALRQNPDDTFAKYNLAVVYQDQGKHEQALTLYKEVLRQTEDTNSRINMAAIYYQRGDHEAAFTALQTASEKNPDNPNPLSALGKYMEDQGHSQEAKFLYREALNVDEKHALSHHRLGQLHAQEENHSTALAHLRKSVEHDGEEPIYLAALAEAEARQGNVYEAIHLLEKASVLKPDHQEYFVRLGDLYKSEGLYQEAVARYWSALAIKDDNAHVHRNLLEIFQTLKQVAEKQLDLLQNQNSLAQTP